MKIEKMKGEFSARHLILILLGATMSAFVAYAAYQGIEQAWIQGLRDAFN